MPKILTILSKIGTFCALFLLGVPVAGAHQPRVVREGSVRVENPEVSQAFYGELKGKPQDFEIESPQPFRLYVGLLSPDLPGARKDFTAEIYEGEAGTGQLLARLALPAEKWTTFDEPFGGDRYWQGPEYRQEGAEPAGVPVPAGRYAVRVDGPGSAGKYVLAVGTKEEFGPRDIWETVRTLPEIKAQFWGKPAYTAFFNLTGLFLLLPLLALAGILLALWRRR
jgi:hypothetical protein